MPEVVDAELSLEPVLGLASGNRHRPRVVDQRVEGDVREAAGERADRLEARQVAAFDPEVGGGDDVATVAGRALAAIRAPAGHDHRRAVAREFAGRLESDAAVRARHDDRSAAPVGRVRSRPSHTGTR